MKPTAQTLAKQFCLGQYSNHTDATLWRDTFAYLAKQREETAYQKSAIAALWARYGGDLRARIKDDALILQVLRHALPSYVGEGKTLYRGESWFLFDQDQLGFCWTPSESVAIRYAKGLNAVDSGGVLLKCYAPPEAILAMVDDVYLCDPARLLRLTTLTIYPAL